jgi:hypothetical protein
MGAFPGVYTQAEEHALRAILREEVEAALVRLGQPIPPWAEVDGLGVDGGTITINIDNSYADDWPIQIRMHPSGQIIELNRLLNIFENAEMHAGFIYDHLRRENEPAEDVARQKALVINRHSAMRKAVTIRDCFDQLAKLLRGEDLDDPEFARAKARREGIGRATQIELDPDEEITGGSRG